MSPFPETACDVLVIGSGAGGLSTAVVAAFHKLPGSLGTFAGLRTDARARVLDKQGNPIPGLYAAGNDMASVMGGNYPSGGITLGPAMTFGYIAARDLAGIDDLSDRAADTTC